MSKYKAGVEVKCPRPKQHLNIIYGEGINDYMDQMQMCMGVTGLDRWWFISFCPYVTDYPLYYKLVERDDAKVEELMKRATTAADQIEELVTVSKSHKTKKAVKEIAAWALEAWALEAWDAKKG